MKIFIILILSHSKILLAQSVEEYDKFIYGNNFCITNSTSAIIFNKNIKDTTPQDLEASSFYPPSVNLEFDCDFENHCEKSYLWTLQGWTITTSDFYENPAEIIIDRRWESFKTTITSGTTEKKKLKSYLIKTDLKDNFSVPISVRIEHDAHIFLCNSSNVEKSSCYWIMLGSHDGTKSQIRKCKSGEISLKEGFSPDTPCSDTLAGGKMTNPLTVERWQHFIISKFEENLTIYHGEHKLLQFLDKNYFNVTHILIHSKKVNGLWKLHDYKFLRSFDPSPLEQIGPYFPVVNREICISMFVKTNLISTLTYRFKCSNKKIDFNINTQGKWQYRKIALKNCDGGVNLYVTKSIDEQNTKHGYWAIDDVRLCNDIEYRYLVSNTAARLQQITVEDNNKFTIPSSKPNKDDINCPEDSFGTACIPCDIFSRKKLCEPFKYCELDKCYCTPGYKGAYCQTDCDDGLYGHGCNKVNHCDKKSEETKITGKCVTCKEPYIGEGDSCNVSSVSFFLSKPIVTEVTYTSFTIQQVNLQHEGDGVKYYFEYAVLDESLQVPWKKILSKTIPINESDVVKFETAQPDTNYTIRTIILGNWNREPKKLVEKFSKNVTITTLCEGILDSDITVNPSNTSAEVTIKKKDNSCRLDRYCVKVDSNKCITLNNYTFTVPNLKPFTNYNITVFRRNYVPVMQFFKTTEGVPAAVDSLTFDKGKTAITIYWQKPKIDNGNISIYKIYYKFLKHIYCSNRKYTNPYMYTTSKDTEKTIENLMPYSEYEIIVRAVINNLEGNYTAEIIKTNKEIELSQKEQICMDTPIIIHSTAMVIPPKFSCELLDGPVNLTINYVCMSEWCLGTSKSAPTNLNNSIRIDNLYPFTSYNITLITSRPGSSKMFSDFKTLQTKTKEPNTVTKLEAYTKDLYSISLHWKPPYPPTGNLKGYKLYWQYTYYFRYEYKDEGYFNITPCQLYNQYHCATIREGLRSNTEYKITVCAINEDPSKEGKGETIVVSTKPEGPDPVDELQHNWTLDNMLYLYWNHPKKTNGLIQYFKIRFTPLPQQHFFYHLDSEDDYKLTYKYQINQTWEQFNCQIFTAFVVVYNQFNYYSWPNPAILVLVPPLIPTEILKDNINLDSTNHTIRININFPLQNSYIKKIFILTSKYNETDDLQEFENGLYNNKVSNLNTSKIVYKSNNINSSLSFEIGNENYTSSNLSNPVLESGTNYSICIYLVNQCNTTSNNVVRLRKIQVYMFTMDGYKANSQENPEPEKTDESNNSLLWILILIVIPFIIFGVWYMKSKKNVSLENILIPKTSTTENDELPLTVKASSSTSKVQVVKPKPTIVIPALQTKHSKKIRITDFEEYVKEAIESGELERQHNLFPKGLLMKHSIGSLPQNKNKNRYKNLIAYDHTRVKLKDLMNSDDTGYINANYIDGYRKPRVYIATQGPKTNTLNDFWKMIWDENVKDIVMLANVYENGKKKVEKYWPDINEEKTYGLIRVQYVSEIVCSNYVLRTFDIFNESEKRKVNQMHYTTWPDHGVPLYPQSLVPFLQILLKIPQNTHTPILIHCSAGVGRTGTIILSDICLRMAAGEGFLDFLAHLENLRNQRANLVDNIEQYKLAHLVVLECLFGMRTAIACTENMENIVETTINNNGIKTQMKYILETQWQDSAMETILDNEEDIPNYPEKDRFSHIKPDQYRVYITRYPHDDETSSYINAVLVNDFYNPGRYIVTQQPMPNTIGDFWRLVLERNCSVIISLNTINLKDQTVAEIWPENGETLEPVDFIQIVHKKTQNLNFYNIITVEMMIKKNRLSSLTDSSMDISIIALDNWRYSDLLPNSIEEFLTFREAADQLSRTCEHVVVMCYDGAKASGLFLALSFIIEQMKLEHSCDVCLAVRSIRHHRKQFVTSEEQYEFLYRAAVTYITGFQSYSNFA